MSCIRGYSGFHDRFGMQLEVTIYLGSNLSNMLGENGKAHLKLQDILGLNPD